jgi:hypothetical protein
MAEPAVEAAWRARSPMLRHAVLLCLNKINAANGAPRHCDCSEILFST